MNSSGVVASVRMSWLPSCVCEQLSRAHDRWVGVAVFQDLRK